MHKANPTYTIVYAPMFVELGNSSYVSCATLELYSLTELKRISTAIFEAPDDSHIGPNMQCTSNMKNNFKIQKRKF
jgi:hypothetical protein